MKATTALLFISLLMSFSFGHAQERRTLNTNTQRVTEISPKRSTLENVQKASVIAERFKTLTENDESFRREIERINQDLYNQALERDLNHYAMRTLVQKRDASSFKVVTRGYPSNVNVSRNGNDVKLIAKNDEDVYRVLYRTDEPKEIVYFINGHYVASEYEVLKMLSEVDTYRTHNNRKVQTTFREVGIKILDGLNLQKLEKNSLRIIKGTYDGGVTAYSDGQSWIVDNRFISGFSGQ